MREQRAQRLRQARISAGFNGPQKVADELNISVNTYKAHEQGRNGFGMAQARAYARLFGVSLNWLYLGAGTPKDSDANLEHLQALFERLSRAPEDVQSRVSDFIEFELSRLEKSRDTATNPVS
ncbi:helix-turn-helix transcriptional regulator [Roseibium salinum]|uniref:helix-turn-helix transcriptional regulator n=1 Tax=Roseibium salinum TaxID=1604349 RepID=UPI003608DCE0